MMFDSIAVHSPYCRTNVVVKMILNESANDAGFPNSSVLKREGRGHTHTKNKGGHRSVVMTQLSVYMIQSRYVALSIGPEGEVNIGTLFLHDIIMESYLKHELFFALALNSSVRARRGPSAAE